MPLINPLSKCLSPKRIVNPYTHESMTVPCGKCQACVLAKNSRYSFQCDLESYCSKHTLFVTLTYANRYIPRATIVDSIERPFGNDLIDRETGEILGNCDLSETEKERLQKKFYLFGDVPYLRKTDLQLFLKRFRYYVTKRLPKEKVRYYAVGEYGPVHFRPHYHLLLFLQSDEALQVSSEAVSEAWQFGRIDVQLSKGASSSYVAGYVNSSVSIPKIFKMPSVRGFCVHSQRLGQGFLASQRAKVYQIAPRDFIKKSIVLNGKYKEFDIWRSAYSYFFPKCKGYADKTPRERAYSYGLYDTARRLFSDAKTTYELAKEIALYIYYFHGSTETYLPDIFGECTDYGVLSRFDNYFYDPLIQSYSIDSEEMCRYVHRIYNELLVSKHFLYFVCDSTSLSEQKRKLKLIDEFYKELDYLRLKDFFESQQLFYESDFIGDEDLLTDQWENSYYPYFYDNVYLDLSVYKKQPVYRMFDTNVKKLFQDRIKHKKLNDLNKIFFEEDNN